MSPSGRKVVCFRPPSLFLFSGSHFNYVLKCPGGGPGGTRGAALRRWQGPRRGEEGDVCSGASQGPLSTGEAGPSGTQSRSPRARLPLGGAEDGRVRSRLEPALPVGGEAAAGCAGGSEAPFGRRAPGLVLTCGAPGPPGQFWFRTRPRILRGLVGSSVFSSVK